MKIVKTYCLGTDTYQDYVIPSEEDAIRHVEETGKPNVCMLVEYDGMISRISNLKERVKQTMHDYK